MLKKTLICLDGSSLAEDILPYIMESCSAYGGEIVMLHVISSQITIPPPQNIHMFTVGRDTRPVQISTSDIGKSTTREPEALPQLKEIEKVQFAARQYLDRLAKPFRASGSKIKTVILEGDPGPTILNYASDSNISLIALTTHGSRGLTRKIMGRVAQRVLKESEIPVLMIKPKTTLNKKAPPQ